MQLAVLDPLNDSEPFPPAYLALPDPNGLLAVGGCLSPVRLVNAYRQGIFPWYNPGEPILWWSPDPRLVLFPEKLNVSRSLAKRLRKGDYVVTYDQAFEQVMDGCAEPRNHESGTWITDEIKDAYIDLHHMGVAHSVEAWCNGELTGGLYGVAIGQVFFGESMFHTRTDASKVAFAFIVEKLRQWNYRLIDCQVKTHHLLSLGAEEIDRQEFIDLLHKFCDLGPGPDAWQAR
ncbi:leucyl/phenylalanyl-tRNA--protein transferase [Methylicorpusculum oleiharenae]|uniref:leucyl/phenylalanyl-tRNA--protein transferase n=1 Tax=Methylicorpusculum oleiharenae TaxID=1338687 RepID=UPI00135798E7|nr:leucyl/phenylalanyl-tRNA--protein transferase [Methylicorpusculum oleiharenae]MCD2453277.1 leucyl/phenylalanyl-tRNA--protein transferase [Methylicorpusculum oleiharenae]